MSLPKRVNFMRQLGSQHLKKLAKEPPYPWREEEYFYEILKIGLR